MKLRSKICILLVCVLSAFCFLLAPAFANEEVVYLGDRQDLMLPRDYEDSIGWNTAHSGEKITVWDLSFEKGMASTADKAGRRISNSIFLRWI